MATEKQIEAAVLAMLTDRMCSILIAAGCEFEDAHGLLEQLVGPALDAAAAAAWESIETAPTDGMEVLVAFHPFNNPSKPLISVRASFSGGCWRDDSGGAIYPPILWRNPVDPPVTP